MPSISMSRGCGVARAGRTSHRHIAWPRLHARVRMSALRSLTVRLLIALVAPLIVAAALIGAGGARATQGVVDYSSDRLLAGSMRAIAESVTVEDGKVWVNLPPWSLGLLDSPQRDSVYYNVRQAGRVLTGYASLPEFDSAALASDGPVFRTLVYNRRSVRQAAEAHRVPGSAAPVIISVAQTLDSREALHASLLNNVRLIEAGLVALVAIFVWPAAMWSLRPLRGLLRELSKRSTSRELDFTPVAATDVPHELQPVVVAFNTVLTQLERSVEGVRAFTADASHQMRTPLAILKTHLTLLKRSRSSAPDRESLTDAVDAVDRLQRLIEQLLALARASAVEEQRGEVADLAQTAREVVVRWRTRGVPALGASRIRAEFSGQLMITLMGPLIEQIVENLLDNAVRYGGPEIRVSVARVENHGVLEVSDSGAGLPPSVAKRAFERFARGPDSSESGSGLGLSIVKALADRCGGKVMIVPASCDKEFAIRVYLPLARTCATCWRSK